MVKRSRLCRLLLIQSKRCVDEGVANSWWKSCWQPVLKTENMVRNSCLVVVYQQNDKTSCSGMVSAPFTISMGCRDAVDRHPTATGS